MPAKERLLLRHLSWIVTVPLAIVAITFSVVNRGRVTIEAWPLPFTIELPLFLVVLSSLVLGVMIGAIVAWLAAGRTRRALRAKAQQTEAAERQVRELKAELERRAASPGRPVSLPVPADAA